MMSEAELISSHQRRAIEEMRTLRPERVITQDEFDDLGKFIAVADELSREPLLSEDNHDSLSCLTARPDDVSARFGHPAFLKSAILPFRKIWMVGEPSYYEGIRDFLYGLFPNEKLLSGYRYWFYDHYERSLSEEKFGLPKVKTVNHVLDIWIHTQGAHTGKVPKKNGRGFHGNYDLRDFDEAVTKVGRAKFEFEFRIALKCVGSTYLSLYRIIAQPLFNRLQREGYQPSFEVMAAMRHNPYPRGSDRIWLNDHFWHLDKETPEQTFDRLLERHSFHDVASFFRTYFRARRLAFDAVKKFSDLENLLKETGGTVCNEISPEDRLVGQFPTRGDFNFDGGKVTVIEGRKVIFAERSRDLLSLQYKRFGEAFRTHRANLSEQPDKWKRNWDGV